MTDMLGSANIRGTKDIGQTDQDEMFQSFGSPLGKDYSFGSMLPTNAVQGFSNITQGLRPGNRFPASLPTGPLSKQRSGQSVGMEGSFRRAQGLGTDITLADRASGISLDFNDPPLMNFY
jgi:hypothetical protein